MLDGLMDFVVSDVEPEAALEGDIGGRLLEEDVPPAGTACAWCKTLGQGHWCQAKRYWGGVSGADDVPICLPCAEGRDCDWVASRQKGKAAVDWLPDMTPESSAASAVRDVTPVDPAKRVVMDAATPVWRNGHGRAVGVGGAKDKATVARHMAEAAVRRERYLRPARTVLDEELEFESAATEGPSGAEDLEGETMPGGRKTSLTEEQQTAIKLSRADETHGTIARRLGVAYHLVANYRKKLPEHAEAGRGRKLVSPKGGPLAMRSSRGVPIDIVDVAAPLPPTIEGGAVAVPQARIDAWFTKLPLERKAEIFLAAVGA